MLELSCRQRFNAGPSLTSRVAVQTPVWLTHCLVARGHCSKLFFLTYRRNIVDYICPVNLTGDSGECSYETDSSPPSSSSSRYPFADQPTHPATPADAEPCARRSCSGAESSGALPPAYALARV